MRLLSAPTSASDAAPGAEWPAQCPELRTAPPAPVLHVPLSAGPGTPADVAPPGRRVARGQVLAQTPAAIGHAVLAPLAGRVGKVVPAALLNGQSVQALELFPDPAGQPQAAPTAGDAAAQTPPAQPLGRDQLPQWLQRLRGLGLWADRRATPRLLAQLDYILSQPADTVMCSLLDDEPSICLNSILAAHASDDLLGGLEFLGRLIQARRVILIVEAGLPGKWWNALRKRARRNRFIVVPLVNDYPQSDPTLLIYTARNRRLNPAALPVEQRVVLLDGAAAVALGRCALRGQPMLSVPLAIRDHIRHQSYFFDVPVGTPLEHLLKEIGCPAGQFTLLRGDVLHLDYVTAQHVVAGGELTIHLTPPLQYRVPDPCVRCSWCVESCPTRIAVANLLDAAQQHDFAAARRYGIDACIECGVCSYVCPSHLPLLGAIRKLKEEMTGAKS